MFITNNHDSFHLWCKKNLVKHQNVSKYYDQNCSSINYPRSTIHLFSKILLDKKTPKPTEVNECNFEIEISSANIKTTALIFRAL